MSSSSEPSEINRRLTLLKLNHDVLSIIISHLPIRDAIAFSYTCKAVNAISINPALHTVVLDRSPSQLKRFKDYLTEPRRNLLKSLTLKKAVTFDIDSDSEAEANALADILEAARKLEHFSSPAIGVLGVASNNRVLDALMSLETLRELEVEDGFKTLAEAICSARTRKLQSFYAGVQLVPSSFNRIMMALAKQPQLSSVTLRALPSLPNNDIGSGVKPSFVLPQVKNLVLEGITISMGQVAAGFPSVSRLTYHRGHSHAADVELAENVWPSTHTLDEVHLSAQDLTYWSLTCPVRWLDLNLLAAGQAEQIVGLVARTTPHVLSCVYRVTLDILFWERLHAVAESLRFLDLRIVEHYSNPKKHMLLYLSKFPALAVIDLCIRGYGLPRDHDAELSKIADDLARRNPALCFIGLSLVDGRMKRDNDPVYDEERLEGRWWAIERDEEAHAAYINGEGSSHALRIEEDILKLVEIPAALGLKIRKFMYETDFASPGWEVKLKDFRNSRYES